MGRALCKHAGACLWAEQKVRDGSETKGSKVLLTPQVSPCYGLACLYRHASRGHALAGKACFSGPRACDSLGRARLVCRQHSQLSC